MDGIIIGGKAYEAIPKGSYHCNDCSLFEQCRGGLALFDICHAFGERAAGLIIFRYSQPLTDKVNRE